MKSWIKDKLWCAIALFLLLGIAWLVGTIIECMKPETKGIRDFLVTFYNDMYNFVNNFPSLFG